MLPKFSNISGGAVSIVIAFGKLVDVIRFDREGEFLVYSLILSLTNGRHRKDIVKVSRSRVE